MTNTADLAAQVRTDGLEIVAAREGTTPKRLAGRLNYAGFSSDGAPAPHLKSAGRNGLTITNPAKPKKRPATPRKCLGCGETFKHVDPPMAQAMVPECVYRGRCPELRECKPGARRVMAAYRKEEGVR